MTSKQFVYAASLTAAAVLSRAVVAVRSLHPLVTIVTKLL